MDPESNRGKWGRLATVARGCERLIQTVGRLSSWLLVMLALVIVWQVVLRYAFGKPSNILGELQWHLYALVGIVGLSFTLAERGHVRVDLFYAKYPPRVARWVDVFGLALFVIPLSCFLLVKGIDFVIPAYDVGESSPEPGGLPFRWVIKGAIPLGALMLVIEATARLVLVFVEDPHASDGRPEG